MAWNLGVESGWEKGYSTGQTGDNGPHSGDMVDNIPDPLAGRGDGRWQGKPVGSRLHVFPALPLLRPKPVSSEIP